MTALIATLKLCLLFSRFFFHVVNVTLWCLICITVCSMMTMRPLQALKKTKTDRQTFVFGVGGKLKSIGEPVMSSPDWAGLKAVIMAGQGDWSSQFPCFLPGIWSGTPSLFHLPHRCLFFGTSLDSRGPSLASPPFIPILVYPPSCTLYYTVSTSKDCPPFLQLMELNPCRWKCLMSHHASPLARRSPIALRTAPR